MTDLVAWLRAQLDDDGRVELANAGQPWPEHCRHDRDEVLRRVDAMRRIVDLHQPQPVWTGSAYEDGKCTTCLISQSDLYGSEYEPSPCPTLRALASMYADRDGYREEDWKPQ